MATPQDVLAFWLDEVGPEGWYKQDEALDARISDLFLDTWEESREGALGLWLTCPSETLAYIIVTDQFPRNMFRGDPRSFATDQPARAAAKMAVSKNWDIKVDEPARQFFYLPMMHSENLSDQDQAVRLFHTRMPDSGAENMDHARAHRQIIRDFGRFPYRNAALSRENTPQERAFLEGAGYGAVLKDIQQGKAAAAG
jgi:uncharacterized protein (DUF924 family)